MMGRRDLQQAVDRISLQRIELYWFFHVLLDRYEFVDEAFRVLRAMIEAGLTASPANDDPPLDVADFSSALTEVESAYDEAGDPDSAWWDVLVSVGQVYDRDYKEAIGRLIVTEDNVAETCLRMGGTHYWWPKVKWPRDRADLEERECSDIAPEEKSGGIKHAALSTGTEIPKPAALNRRCRRLRIWLTEKGIPEKDWLHLKGWGLENIYYNLIEFDEFSTKTGDAPIALSTFKREFWRRQKICKLDKTSNKQG